MHKLFFLFILFVLVGCQTNPPTDPNSISLKTGEIVLRVSFTQNPSLDAGKTVLLEDFANVSCVPCVVSNKIIESLTRNTYSPEKLVAVKFPTNFPSPVDPFYLGNSPVCDFRMSYYNIFAAPTIIIDGLQRPIPTDSNSVMNAINQRLVELINVQFEVSKQNITGGILFDLNIQVKDTNAIDFNGLYFHFAVVESEVEFSSPPGSNGETKFYDVMRQLLPSNEGYLFSDFKRFTGDPGIFRYENTIDSTWNLDKINGVFYLQNSSTKEILQAGSSL